MSIDFNTLKADLEKALQQALPPANAQTESYIPALHHAVFAGGKRVRSLLVYLVAAACGCPLNEDVRHTACAIELLHSYTLIHDDLPAMDNDTLRRGQPSVWAKFGEGQAILAGDELQALAFRELTFCASSSKLLPILATAAIDVVHGQVADIQAAKLQQTAWTRELLDYIVNYKTVRLFETACALGAIAANATDAQREALIEYGRQLGFAFQLIDDLQDAQQTNEGNEFSAIAVLGKDKTLEYARAATLAAKKALAQLPKASPELEAFADQLLARTY